MMEGPLCLALESIKSFEPVEAFRRIMLVQLEPRKRRALGLADGARSFAGWLLSCSAARPVSLLSLDLRRVDVVVVVVVVVV